MDDEGKGARRGQERSRSRSRSRSRARGGAAAGGAAQSEPWWGKGRGDAREEQQRGAAEEDHGREQIYYYGNSVMDAWDGAWGALSTSLGVWLDPAHNGVEWQASPTFPVSLWTGNGCVLPFMHDRSLVLEGHSQSRADAKRSLGRLIGAEPPYAGSIRLVI